LNWVWSVRAWIDRRFGGRTLPMRPDERDLEPGVVFDFWRVLAVEPLSRLTLYCLLRAPGAGGFEIEMEPAGEGARLNATIHWHPAGFKGLFYWFALWPPHALVLGRMTRAIARRAEQIARGAASPQNASASWAAASP
jgi:hypothetical protein